MVAVACVAMTRFVNLPAIVAAQSVAGVAGAVFPSAVAAITLGIVGYQRLPARLGRNEAFNHTGNVAAAVLAGLIGHFIACEGIFYLVAAMALASVVSVVSVVSVMLVKEKDIDHELVQGAKAEGEKDDAAQVAGIRALLTDCRVLMFALAITLFHFANAAMLPLAGQLLSKGQATGASLYMLACIIAAQLVMIPVAVLAGKYTQTRGRKPVFLVGFIVLPIRGLLYTFSDHPVYIVMVQLLDGIGAGIFGVLWVLVVADLTKGTGRYNLTQGAIATAVGIGAALSNLVTGHVVAARGYNAGFLMLSGVAVVALFVYHFAMPETKPASEPDQPPGTTASPGLPVTLPVSATIEEQLSDRSCPTNA